LNGESIQSGSEFIKITLSGQYPFIPPLNFPMVDVRDVASAHIACVENENAKGRYLTSNGHGWLLDLAKIAREKYYPEYSVPDKQLPVWLFKVVGYFDKRLDKGLLQESTQEGLKVDASKICKDLDFKYQYEMKQSMLDHCQSLIDFNLIFEKK
jgi:nucleoside-diphosphate-sugar epimerase